MNNSINDILQFNFSQKLFAEEGDSIIPTHITNLCELRISTLKSINEQIGNSMIIEMPKNGIIEVYYKFIELSDSGESLVNKFDKRELRTLTFALTVEPLGYSIYENIDDLELCLALLDQNWRDSFLSGLINCYLFKWKGTNKESFNLLSQFIINKIENYNGNRNLYVAFKKNIKFFDKDKGDLELGFTLAIHKISISNATKFLSLPDHWITFPYFFRVIEVYYKNTKKRIETILDDLSDTLEQHSSSTKGTKLNKLIVSQMIKETQSASEVVQNKVKIIAFKLVGDPGKNTAWRPYENANHKEFALINNAREILNEWVTRQFISVFFEKCINDNRRKIFWLKYSKKITAFKVFGPSKIKNKLLLDERIAEYVDVRFYTIDTIKDVSAFMFLIGDHKMIEFSDPGYAFYAYKSGNPMAPDFDSKDIFSVDEFRNGSMPLLVYRKKSKFKTLSDEGRLTHANGDLIWEDVFSYWLKEKAGVDV